MELNNTKSDNGRRSLSPSKRKNISDNEEDDGGWTEVKSRRGKKVKNAQNDQNKAQRERNNKSSKVKMTSLGNTRKKLPTIKEEKSQSNITEYMAGRNDAKNYGNEDRSNATPTKKDSNTSGNTAGMTKHANTILRSKDFTTAKQMRDQENKKSHENKVTQQSQESPVPSQPKDPTPNEAKLLQDKANKTSQKEKEPQKDSSDTSTQKPNNKELQGVWKNPAKIQQTIARKMKKDENTKAVEISFDLQNVDPNHNLKNQGEHMRSILKQILHRGRNVAGNHKFAIEPFFEEKGELMKIGSIMSTMDIPKAQEFEILRTYITHDDEKPGSQRKWLITGKNSRWKIRIALKGGITFDKFIHAYDQSRNDFNIKSQFIPMKLATHQGDYSWCLGYLNNSSEKQLINKIEQDLSKEINANLNIQFRNIPGSYSDTDAKWQEAKKAANGDKRMIYRWAPMALAIYTDERSGAVRMKTVEKLNDTYGKQNKNGQYPRFSDGSRMRFVPSYQYLSLMERDRAKPIMDIQIHLKKSSLEYPLEISKEQINTVIKSHKKTLGEMILGIQDKVTQEPIFRHFTMSWSRVYEERKVQVSVMEKLAKKARATISNLREILQELYGDEAIKAYDGTTDTPNVGDQQHQSTIMIDVNDRYLNGNATCLIEGMEELLKEEKKHKKTAEKNNKKPTNLCKTFGLSTDEISNASTASGSKKQMDLASEITEAEMSSFDNDSSEEDSDESDVGDEEDNEDDSNEDSDEYTVDDDEDRQENEANQGTDKTWEEKYDEAEDEENHYGEENENEEDDYIPEDLNMDNEIEEAEQQLDSQEEHTSIVSDDTQSNQNRIELKETITSEEIIESSQQKNLVERVEYLDIEEDDVNYDWYEEEDEFGRAEDECYFPRPNYIKKFRSKWGNLKKEMYLSPTYYKTHITERMQRNPIQSLDLDFDILRRRNLKTDSVTEAAILVRECFIGWADEDDYEDLILRAHTNTVGEELFYQLQEEMNWSDDMIDGWIPKIILPEHIEIPDSPPPELTKIPHNIKKEIFLYFGSKIHQYLLQLSTGTENPVEES